MGGTPPWFRNKFQRLTPEQIEIILIAKEAGYTNPQIARMLNCSYDRVRYNVHQWEEDNDADT